MDAIAQPKLQEKSNSYAYRSCINEGIGFAALCCLIKTKNNSCNGWL
jgi:hypothetical protein